MRCAAFFMLLLLAACGVQKKDNPEKIKVVFDTDTNNEVDDQHALAYLVFSGVRFDIAGITVNVTRGGGRIDEQYAEAVRVARLCGFPNVPIYKGANSSFDSIPAVSDSHPFDGSVAVNFIVSTASASTVDRKLTIIAVGKLTNIALALKLKPAIAANIRLVWLGSNYPDPGEYNLDNDTSSLNYVLRSTIALEIVTVRYGRGHGSDVVRFTPDEIKTHLAGTGPVVAPVTGRHGGTFSNFGDYSLNLFNHVKLNGSPPSRALFDMVAVAIVKEPAWGHSTEVVNPLYINAKWVQGINQSRKVIVWGDFSAKAITNDFYKTIGSGRGQ